METAYVQTSQRHHFLSALAFLLFKRKWGQYRCIIHHFPVINYWAEIFNTSARHLFFSLSLSSSCSFFIFLSFSLVGRHQYPINNEGLRPNRSKRVVPVLRHQKWSWLPFKLLKSASSHVAECYLFSSWLAQNDCASLFKRRRGHLQNKHFNIQLIWTNQPANEYFGRLI